MQQLQEIDLFAGYRPDGEKVAEKIQVKKVGEGEFELVRSPCFTKGLALGDKIVFDDKDNSFELKTHSGNVCIRVYAKEDLTALRADITPKIEKLGGSLDYENQRLLVYSIHVSCGFKEIERTFNDHIDEDAQQMWLYGNVYDPVDGVTPLNWWQSILNEK